MERLVPTGSCYRHPVRTSLSYIEGLNRQFRQITKTKPFFTNDDFLRRRLYLTSQRIMKHWHSGFQNWDMVLNQLEIMFADRKVGFHSTDPENNLGAGAVAVWAMNIRLYRC